MYKQIHAVAPKIIFMHAMDSPPTLLTTELASSFPCIRMHHQPTHKGVLQGYCSGKNATVSACNVVPDCGNFQNLHANRNTAVHAIAQCRMMFITQISRANSSW